MNVLIKQGNGNSLTGEESTAPVAECRCLPWKPQYNDALGWWLWTYLRPEEWCWTGLTLVNLRDMSGSRVSGAHLPTRDVEREPEPLVGSVMPAVFIAH